MEWGKCGRGVVEGGRMKGAPGKGGEGGGRRGIPGFEEKVFTRSDHLHIEERERLRERYTIYL